MSKERYELRYVGDWYCYVYDNEKQQGADICSLDDSVRIFNEQDKKIKDLETKLADLQQEQIKEMQEHQEAMLVADKTVKSLEDKLAESFAEKDVEGLIKDREETIKVLKQQLAEKESEADQRYKDWQEEIRECDGLRVVLSEVRKQLDDTETQNKRVLEKLELIVRANQELEQKLAEKDKEISNLKGLVNERDKQIKNLKTNKKRVVEHKNKVKISFAVEQLEKVKENIIDRLADIDRQFMEDLWDEEQYARMCWENWDTEKFIDNQIKAIKEMK